MKRAKVRRQLVAALATMLPADEEVVEAGRAWMADRRPGVPLAFTGRAPYLAAVTDRRLVVFDRPRRGRPVLEADLRFARRFAVLELGSVRRWTPLMQVRVKLPDDDREVVIELRPRDRPLGRALVSAFGAAVAPAPGAVPSETPGREAEVRQAPGNPHDATDELDDLDAASGGPGAGEDGGSGPGEPIPPDGSAERPEPTGRGAGAPGTGATPADTIPPALPDPRPPADTPSRTRPLPPAPPGWAATPGWSITPGWSMTPGWSATPGLAATPRPAALRGWPAPAPSPAPPPVRTHHPGPGPKADPATAGPEDARR